MFVLTDNPQRSFYAQTYYNWIENASGIGVYPLFRHSVQPRTIIPYPSVIHAKVHLNKQQT